MITNEEKAFLDKLIEIGKELMNEAKKNNIVDDERFVSISASPKRGYVSVSITKDDVIKGAHVFRAFPDTEYSETKINE